ncbi:type II secretion system F family protein [Novipirellula artificiosorum]|uniref:Bacterial type II secretion system protein F domain protein n=1 Tax=Novipirellula artificiosorum TaxID=2528016 RepID=A0A5C6DJU2_9BACT|nr:type II secretion system F family protein [Novipirellula artificiosorum]TWU35851.1 Bacterial type II secretion system protein F domain protein [Novipirellula artificiosorum]
MSGIVIVIAVGVFVASLVAFAINIMMPGTDSTSAEDRLAAMASRRGGRGVEESEYKSLLLSGSEGSGNRFARFLEELPGLSDYLEQADIKMPATQYAFICLVSFAAGLGLCILAPVPKLLAPLVGLAFLTVPVGWLLMKRKRRLAKFGLQMPEALELLGRSLRAGHSLNAGFDLVAKQMEAPLATEFGRTFEEQNFGIPLDEAIEGMAARVPNMDLRFFATAVVLQRQTGGDLAEILDKIGYIIRERLQIHGQIQALTGEGRMSGAVLLALPPVLFLVMLKLNYDYVMMLFIDEIGRYLLGIALVTQIIGALVIKKIITIKV